VEIVGMLKLEDEEVHLVVEGEYERYASNPASDYIRMRDEIINSRKEETE